MDWVSLIVPETTEVCKDRSVVSTAADGTVVKLTDVVLEESVAIACTASVLANISDVASNLAEGDVVSRVVERAEILGANEPILLVVLERMLAFPMLVRA